MSITMFAIFQSFPENVPQEIESASKEMLQSCSQLALRILELLSIGLNKVRFICYKSSKALTHFTSQGTCK